MQGLLEQYHSLNKIKKRIVRETTPLNYKKKIEQYTEVSMMMTKVQQMLSTDHHDQQEVKEYMLQHNAAKTKQKLSETARELHQYAREEQSCLYDQKLLDMELTRNMSRINDLFSE